MKIWTTIKECTDNMSNIRWFVRARVQSLRGRLKAFLKQEEKKGKRNISLNYVIDFLPWTGSPEKNRRIFNVNDLGDSAGSWNDLISFR